MAKVITESTHGHHQMVNAKIRLCSLQGRWRSCKQSAKTKPGADCVSEHEFLIAKFSLKMPKVGKTTRPFRYDVNLIPCYYTMEVMNRFEGLNLVDRIHEELWREVCHIVLEALTKTIPKNKNVRRQSGFLRRP